MPPSPALGFGSFPKHCQGPALPLKQHPPTCPHPASSQWTQILQFYQPPGSFPSGSVVKNPPVNAGDTGLIPGSGRSPGEGNGRPLQYSCPENSMYRGAWQVTVHGVAKSQTQLSDFTFTFFHFIIYGLY